MLPSISSLPAPRPLQFHVSVHGWAHARGLLLLASGSSTPKRSQTPRGCRAAGIGLGTLRQKSDGGAKGQQLLRTALRTAFSLWLCTDLNYQDIFKAFFVRGGEK